MMIKKQLGILAGAVALASGANVANAALDLNNVHVVLSAAGQGAYVVDSGVTTAAATGGTGFTIDITAAIAALGGSIDSFAVLGVQQGSSVYNPYESTYVDNGGGVLFSSTAPVAPASNSDNTSLTNNVLIYFGNADLGLNADGTGGDLDFQGVSAAYGGLLTSSASLADLWFSQTNLGPAPSFNQVAITSPSGAQEGAYIDGTDFYVTAESAVIPIPAAAWLFGSALVGLGVVRRKA